MFRGSVAACLRAGHPTSVSPSAVSATTEGTNRRPEASGTMAAGGGEQRGRRWDGAWDGIVEAVCGRAAAPVTPGSPSSTTATAEFVVPRSVVSNHKAFRRSGSRSQAHARHAWLAHLSRPLSRAAWLADTRNVERNCRREGGERREDVPGTRRRARTLMWRWAFAPAPT